MMLLKVSTAREFNSSCGVFKSFSLNFTKLPWAPSEDYSIKVRITNSIKFHKVSSPFYLKLSMILLSAFYLTWGYYIKS